MCVSNELTVDSITSTMGISKKETRTDIQLFTLFNFYVFQVSWDSN
jgi:hypothetical protein